MKSCFLVARFGVETMNPLGGVNLVIDSPCIKKHFGKVIQLFEGVKDPSFGQQ
jgi:hypothetical protein